MPDELHDLLHRLAPEIDQAAHRDLFESSRGRSGTSRTMTLAAAVVLVLGGVTALIWLTGRDDVTPADEPMPSDTVEPTSDPTAQLTLTEGDGYDTVLVAESQTGFGDAELVATDDELAALWSEWNPGPERPAIDFSSAVALVTTRPDNACPDTLVRLDRDPGTEHATWTAVFEDLSAACEDPLLSWIYVVAFDRAVLGDAATIVLPAQEIFDVAERRLEFVAADPPPGSSSTVDVETMEETGIVLDRPPVGSPTLHNTSLGLLWVVAHEDGTMSVLPATVDAGRVGGEDAGAVAPQERLVYLASGGDLFFSGPMNWDAHGRTITGGRTNDLVGFVGRVDGDQVHIWSTDAEQVDGAPDPAPDRVGTSPDLTLAELRRAAGEPIDTSTFFTLSSTGPVWRYLDATLAVEDGVGRICELPTDVPVDEQTGCDDEGAAIATQITSSDPTITTWFHPPILAFQDPLRGFTSFVPLGGLSSRNDAVEGDAEGIVTDVRFQCGRPGLAIEVDIEFLTVDSAEIVVIDGDVELTRGTLSGGGEMTGGWALTNTPTADAELRVSFGTTDLTLPVPDEVPDCSDAPEAACGALTPPFLPSGADVGGASELLRGNTRTIAWGDLTSDDVVRQYPDVDLELLPLEADSPQLLTNGTETMHVVPVGDPPVGEIQLGLTDALGCVRHYSIGPGVELDAAIDYARRWLAAI